MKTVGDPTEGEINPENVRRKEPWHIVACAMVGGSVGASVVAHYGLGVFIKDIAHDLQWSRSGASNAISLYLVGLGLGVPIAGYLIDRFGPKRIAMVSIISLALSLIAISRATSSAFVIFLCPVMGFVGSATTLLPYTVTIASRFQRNRGLAMGVAATATGFGGIFVPHMLAWTTGLHDWRIALLVFAALIMALALPAAFIGLANARPERKRGKGLGTASLPSLWRSRSFLLTLATISVANAAVGGVVVHAVPFLTDNGLSAPAAAAALSAVAGASLVGRVGGGILMDRYFAPYVGASFFFIFSLGTAILILLPSGTAAFLGFALIGVTLGIEADLVGFLVSKYVPPAQHGSAIGLLVGAYTLSNAMGVALLGRAYEFFGSYETGLIVAACFGPLAAFIVTRLRDSDRYIVESH